LGVTALAVALSAVLVLVGGGEAIAAKPSDRDKLIKRIEQNFTKSLHRTRAGKRTYYEAHDGFVNLTGVPYDELACQDCHATTSTDGTQVDVASYEPTCADCHADADTSDPYWVPVTEGQCLGCHQRQGVEHMMFQEDVHRKRADPADPPFVCMDCHTLNEMHGDGKKYKSLHDKGAMEASCTNTGCHGDANRPHQQKGVVRRHLDTVDCSACHVQSVITCESCHFESEVEAGVKRFYAPPHQGFKLLMQKDGKVKSATYQTLTFGDKSFYVLAPYVAHSITRDNIHCSDCHLYGGGSQGNAALQEYVDTGMITVTQWDENEGKLVGPLGVIPVPPDWRDALRFSFVTYDGELTDPNLPPKPALWSFLKDYSDLNDMPYGEPLSSEQMEALISAGMEGPGGGS
jgi:hypothetical protein